MKSLKVICFCSFIFLLFISSILHGSTLVGKLVQFGKKGIENSPFIPLTLYSETTRKKIENVTSGSDGIYYFKDIKTGSYILKIWVLGFKNEPLIFTIHVKDQSNTNIKPILIHDISFSFPKNKQRFYERKSVRPIGVHYSLPDRVFIWILASDKYKRRFYLWGKKPITIKEDGTWEGESGETNIYMEKIHIVFVTEDTNKTIEKNLKRYKKEGISNLPEDSYIFLSQDITVVDSR